MLVAFGCRDYIWNFQFTAELEPLDDRLEIDVGKMFAEDAANGGANEFACDSFGAFQFAFVFEFEFAGDGRERSVEIGDAADGVCFAGASGALLGAADQIFESGDRKTLADAGAFVNALVIARLERDFLDNFAKVIGNFDSEFVIAVDPGFLGGDGDTFLNGGGIVGANFGSDTVFERGDDFAASGVVIGIGGEDEKDVKRKAEGIALNLNVALLHDVEEADLDFAGEVGKFVDGEDAAIGAGKQAVVNGEFVGEIAAATGGADGVDVADNVGDGDVGSGKFFNVALVARHPGDGSVVAFGGDTFAAGAADGAERMIVDFAALDDGNLRVEELHEATENAALGLAAEAEKNKIVAGEKGVDDLRDNTVFVAVDAGKEGFVALEATKEIAANFVFDGECGGVGVEIGDALPFAKSFWASMS